MQGQLRTDLYASLLEWEQRTDLCLTMGTSLAGMNADRMASTVAQKAHRNEGGALGTVIISLQQTALDSEAALRIFARIDDVMTMLANELNVIPSSPPVFVSDNDVFEILYDKDGLRGEKSTLDLRDGARVRITSGPYAGDEGEVVGKQRHGHYKIRFMHTVKGTWKVPQEHVFGRWMAEEAVKGLLPHCPIAQVDVAPLATEDVTEEGTEAENQAHFEGLKEQAHDEVSALKSSPFFQQLAATHA